MCTHIDCCFLSFVYIFFLKTKSLGLWCQHFAEDDITQAMHTCHRLYIYSFDDVAWHFTMSLSRYAQNTPDAWRPLIMLLVVSWCLLHEARRPWQMPPSQSTHSKTEVWRTWLKNHIICRCLLANVSAMAVVVN